MNYVTTKERSRTAESRSITHGGRVYEASRRWGIDPDQVIDFSANINPLGPPQGVLAAVESSLSLVNLRVYPDAHDFVSALADRHRLMPDEIVVGSGTASLMFAVLPAVLPKSVLVLEPSFGEYSRACIAVNGEVTRWLLSAEDAFTPNFASLVRAVKERQFDLVILNSPHNPTGALYPRDALLSLIETAEMHNVTVMLDEAFMDYAPQWSLVSLAATKSHLVVLRSLTKFYAMPGVRVGYAVCGTKLAGKIRKQIDPWSVSTVALEAGRAALNEDEFDEESRRVNNLALEEFAGALRGIGLHVFPSAANFLLAKLPCSSGADLEGWLDAERILVRRCDSFRGLGDQYVRLAVRSSSDNLRLVSLIEAWLKRSELEVRE
jgi:threonine-phosphate decarboxylase